MSIVVPLNNNHIPEHIHLPDGRSFATKQLLKSVRNRRSHTIGSKSTHYRLMTNEDKKDKREHHLKMSKSKIKDVMEEYNIRDIQAWNKIKYSCLVLGLPVPKKSDHL